MQKLLTGNVLTLWYRDGMSTNRGTTVRLPDDVWDWVRERAARGYCSQSSVIEFALRAMMTGRSQDVDVAVVDGKRYQLLGRSADGPADGHGPANGGGDTLGCRMDGCGESWAHGRDGWYALPGLLEIR